MSLTLRPVIALGLRSVPLVAQRAPLFKDEILPVLEKNCTACHGPDRKWPGWTSAPSPA